MRSVRGLRKPKWEEGRDGRTRRTNTATKPEDGIGGEGRSLLECTLFGEEPLGFEIVDVGEIVLISAHCPVRS